MYYPIQIPFVLNKEFSKYIKYSEEVVAQFSEFVICFWDMQLLTNEERTVDNIIITDACIDIVVDFTNKKIGYCGMSKTRFDQTICTPEHFFGARLKPGAFHALTNIHADKAMDTFLHINTVDKKFDEKAFFSQDISAAKKSFKQYIENLQRGKTHSAFMTLFDELNRDTPDTVREVYEKMYRCPRQCQRLFVKNFGLTPQMILCILRFQKCLHELTSGKKETADIMYAHNYYDQSHFINDFKRNIGLTPLELVRKYGG